MGSTSLECFSKSESECGKEEYGKLLCAVGNPCSRGNLVCPYLCKGSAIKKEGAGRKKRVRDTR
jgi:hypothetical protein